MADTEIFSGFFLWQRNGNRAPQPSGVIFLGKAVVRDSRKQPDFVVRPGTRIRNLAAGEQAGNMFLCLQFRRSSP
jgi:hypothetical protein